MIDDLNVLDVEFEGAFIHPEGTTIGQSLEAEHYIGNGDVVAFHVGDILNSQCLTVAEA